jgi:hypothetical protein
MEGYWNASQPAYHFENYAHASRHNPTMIFNASFAANGDMQWISVYACESHGQTSFQLLSRQLRPPQHEIDAYTRAAAEMGLDVGRLEVIDFTACRWGA